jgi:hypothetical protein
MTSISIVLPSWRVALVFMARPYGIHVTARRRAPPEISRGACGPRS